MYYLKSISLINQLRVDENEGSLLIKQILIIVSIIDRYQFF
jgi:hypothetical protein